MAMPPTYNEGMAAIYPHDVYPAAVTGNLPVLVLEESPGSWVSGVFLPNAPTSWNGNVRVGDRVQFQGSGMVYTVAGPMAMTGQDNPDLFVNTGPPGSPPVLTRTFRSPDGTQMATMPVEFLLLTNGRDDNFNGWVDEGWDGVDNNGDGQIDEPVEWEVEAWEPSYAESNKSNIGYAIQRRPVPATGATVTLLPSGIVVEGARSRLPVNRFTGNVDVLINPDGTVRPNTFYSSPASVPMNGGFLHFWLAERADLGTAPKGSWWLVTLFARTGQITAVENPSLTDPFSASQQGVR